jgi:hypothetical protein
MEKGTILIVCCALAFPAIAFAQTAPTKVAPAYDVRKAPPAIDAFRGGILRQDLFDRNNPNNLRSDWPSPPGQPG